MDEDYLDTVVLILQIGFSIIFVTIFWSLMFNFNPALFLAGVGVGTFIHLAFITYVYYYDDGDYDDEEDES